MKKIGLKALLAASVIFAASCNDTKTANNNEDSKEVAKEQNDEKFDDTNIEDDTKFAVNAADGGMLEVKLGELAETKAFSAEAKQFGKTMKEEHSKANEELKALAAQKNISLPATLSDKKQEKYDELAKKTGKDFDKEYIDFMVKDHKDDIDAFEKEADKGKDADLKNWAAAKLPTLRHHLEMAEGAQESLKNRK